MTLNSQSRSRRSRQLGQGQQTALVLLPHVLHMAEPIVRQPQSFLAKHGAHTAAAVVTANDDVFDPQDIHGELRHRQAVEIRMHHHVGHVAVDE